MKYIFACLSIKGITLSVDTEKLKASQDKTLANDFLEVIEERTELEVGDLKFKFISVVDEKSTAENGEKRRKF